MQTVYDLASTFVNNQQLPTKPRSATRRFVTCVSNTSFWTFPQLGPRRFNKRPTPTARPSSTMTAVLPLGSGPKDLARQILDHQAPKYNFSFSPFLLENYRHGITPDRPLCKAYLQGHCPLGPRCPDRHAAANHSSNYNNLVCKHWLRGLCKKGDSCEFLHEYNLRKMPECNFFVKNGYCSNGGMFPGHVHHAHVLIYV